MNPDPPIAISLLFVVVPIFILAVLTIFVVTLLSRYFERGPDGSAHRRPVDASPDPMMDPANPISPLYQATQMPGAPDAQSSPPTDSHPHHGGHHSHHSGGGFDGGSAPFDGGHHGGGFDGGSGGHHH